MQLERSDLKHPIESQSYEVINESFDPTRYSELEAEIAKRIVHATADFELGYSLQFPYLLVVAVFVALPPFPLNHWQIRRLAGLFWSSSWVLS